MSALVDVALLVSVDVVAPVALAEPLVAPMVLLLEELLGYVLVELDVLGVVLLLGSVDVLRDVVSVEDELGNVLEVDELEDELGNVLEVDDDVSGEVDGVLELGLVVLP